jgi:hypothetical protein
MTEPKKRSLYVIPRDDGYRFHWIGVAWGGVEQDYQVLYRAQQRLGGVPNFVILEEEIPVGVDWTTLRQEWKDKLLRSAKFWDMNHDNPWNHARRKQIFAMYIKGKRVLTGAQIMELRTPVLKPLADAAA